MIKNTFLMTFHIQILYGDQTQILINININNIYN